VIESPSSTTCGLNALTLAVEWVCDCEACVWGVAGGLRKGEKAVGAADGTETFTIADALNYNATGLGVPGLCATPGG